MEESTNTFTGGLNQDLNPIATPNNVLTDAKNATFITFNGNEMSLQNDMGNTKITYTDPITNETQSVTLPQGYVPLGVKEYGGILYIVSKNPSTEQVEIGSFPSPEFVSDDEKPLSIEETKITNDSGELLDGSSSSMSESGIFDISTEILHPCDRIKDYSFFPLNFETISTQDERRLFKYKLINNSTRKDITNLSQPFNLSNKVWYKTLQLTKNGVQKYPVVVYFPNIGGVYTYYEDGTESGIKPDEFASYIYEVGGELRLSMYYEGGEGIKYTFSLPSSGGRAQAKLNFKYGGDGIYYFPNLQPGTLSFKFYTETIDYFNLHRIEDSVVKYSPKLVKEAFQFDDIVINNITETFSNTFFTTNEHGTITPTQFTSPTGITNNTILPYDSNKYSLQICSDNGVTYPYNSDFNRSILDESKRFMTISYTGGEFIHQVETNDQQYSLKFDKIKVDQLSWVKVNKVIFSYEIFNNNNPSFSIYKDEQTYNNVKIIDGEWDISGLSIAIPSEEREVKLGVFLGRENYPKYLGTGSNGNVVLSHFTTVKISNISGAPNYTVKFSFTPYNTDYNIDISQFKIDRTIDLTKSPDSWEGNLVFKDNEDSINVSLDNCLIKKGSDYYSLLDLKDDLPINQLSKGMYKHSAYIPLSQTIEKKKKQEYKVITPTRENINSGKYVQTEYFVPEPTIKNITLVDKVELALNKYFNWEGALSTSLFESNHQGAIALTNFGNYDYYKASNILKVGEERNFTEFVIIPSAKQKTVEAPNVNFTIKSENGVYDVSNIKRGIKCERELEDIYYTKLCYAWTDDEVRVKNPNKLGYSITPTKITYKGSKSYSSKYSQLYYIRKNASDAPCDSFGQYLIDSEFIPTEVYGFNNIFNEWQGAHLYTSVVPIKSDFLSRAQIQLNKAYSSTFRTLEIFTFSFYLSKNFKGKLSCNADVLKIRTDKEIIDSDSISFDNNQYAQYDSIDIESGSKKYTRVVLICKGSSLQNDFYFTFREGTSGSIIYNPVLYESQLRNLSGSSADCVDLRGQGMRLLTPEGSEDYVNKKLGDYKLHADYVPVPFYEIID